MNDYPFGNFLYEKRKQAGLTQRQAAAMLGVSDKAVSKWENGRSKPTTEMLRKLSVLYMTSVEQLLQLQEEAPRAKITKIVLTGGPSAGKTTALSWIRNEFTKLGYTVLIIAETATELISSGVAPWTCRSNLDYQRSQMRLQLDKERVYERAAAAMPVEKILIVCDRGAMDNKAYMTQEEFDEVLRYLDLHEIELRDNYDGVFHLVTAANGALEAYSSANNAARYETAEEA